MAFLPKMARVIGALAALLCAPPVLAADTDPFAAAPWIAAAQVARDTARDIERTGPQGIASHVQALEEALSEGAKAFPPPPAADGGVTLLADGAAQTKAARAAAAQQGHTVVADNPYPRIGYYLGTYYNNNGRPNDALRVLALGVKLTEGDQKLGGQMPDLYSETGFALEILKRWPDSLQICQTGLSLAGADRLDRARLYRCAGYSLSELGRYDEAATAYRAAIRLDPGNTIAPIELEYVLRNKAKAAAPPP